VLFIKYHFLLWRNSPCGLRSPHYRGFIITLSFTTLPRTPLDERSAYRRDLYLTTHNVHKRQTSMPLTGFEPTIPGSERPPTDALDHATTATGIKYHWVGRIKDDKMYRTQGWTKPGRQFALVTKFTTIALNIFESSVWILFLITLQAPVILSWLLDFFLVECIARVVVIGNGHKIEGC